jgi:phage gpG-like protein
MAQVALQIRQAAVRALFVNPQGGVANDLLRRGRNVAYYARRYAPVDTGRLRASINTRLVQYNGEVAVLVGTNVNYAMFQHEGTGIYGPHGTPIVPRTARFLKFRPKGSSVFVYARSVRGNPPTFFLRRALAAARR